MAIRYPLRQSRTNTPLAGVRAAIAASGVVIPAISVEFTELRAQNGKRMAAQRTAWLAGAFGVLAVVIVTAGLYGIIAYLAAQSPI